MTKSHSSRRFCSWKATHSYFQKKEKVTKEIKLPPKPMTKYSIWSGGKPRRDPQPDSLAKETHEEGWEAQW